MKSNRLLIGAFSALLLASAGLGVARAADDGAAVYKTKCNGCHGEDGAGQTSVGKMMKAPDLKSADVQKKSDEQIADAIENGKGKMPATKGVTPDQVKSLVAYTRALAKKK